MDISARKCDKFTIENHKSHEARGNVEQQDSDIFFQEKWSPPTRFEWEKMMTPTKIVTPAHAGK